MILKKRVKMEIISDLSIAKIIKCNKKFIILYNTQITQEDLVKSNLTAIKYDWTKQKQVIILKVKMFSPLIKKDGIYNFSVSNDNIRFSILIKEN